MDILLDGFFDRNYGDDMMQLLIVKGLPQHNFYVEGRVSEMLGHLKQAENVHITDDLPYIDAYVKVIGTGFMYNSKRDALLKLKELYFHGKKYPKNVVINCSMEEIKGKVSDYATRKALSVYDFITCRDRLSFEYIRSECGKSNSAMYEDVVFSAAEQFNIEEGAERGDCLGISVYRRADRFEGFSYFKAIASFCDCYVERKNKKVLIFALDSGKENDVSAALSVMNMMKHSEKAEIVIYNSDPVWYARQFLRCGEFLGSRFHGIVTALSLGIPVIAVSDRAKLDRLCRLCNITCLYPADIDDKQICEYVDSFKSVRKIDYMKRNARGHIEALNEYLNKG